MKPLNVDNRTEAEIDESYRRAAEAVDPIPEPEWWNSPTMTLAVLLGLIALTGLCLWMLI